MSVIEEHQIQQSGERSKLATVSLVFSLIFCCPLTTILAPILGVVAFLGLRKNPGLKGKGFAISGIIIGILTSIIWIVSTSYFGNLIYGFIQKSTQVTTHVIQTGTNGEYDECRTYFSSQYSDISNEEIKSFVDTLQERYGNFDSVTLNMEQQSQELNSTSKEAVIPVQIVFETTNVYAETMLEIVQVHELEFEFKLTCLKILDTKHGHLVFPPDSPCK